MTNLGRHKRNTEILSMLLEKADVQGYLTTEDLMELYPQVSEDADRLEAIVLALRRRGVVRLDVGLVQLDRLGGVRRKNSKHQNPLKMNAHGHDG